MHYLVVTTLQEGRVDGAEWHQTLTGQPTGECHTMLLSDSHIEDPVGELFLEAGQARATSHGSVNGNNPAVAFCLGNEGVGKVVGV